MLELLLATPWPDDARTSSASSASSTVSSAPGSAAGGSSSCALLVFLRFLLQKNMYALRDVPPPGLSEPTVLMSAFFGLLQLLQPALQAACEGNTGPLAAFPAAELFAGVGPAAEAEPVFNMPRLGGVVTHLAREHPVGALEKHPVEVQPEGQAGRKAAGSSAYGGSSFLQVGLGGDPADCCAPVCRGDEAVALAWQHAVPLCLLDEWMLPIADSKLESCTVLWYAACCAVLCRTRGCLSCSTAACCCMRGGWASTTR